MSPRNCIALLCLAALCLAASLLFFAIIVPLCFVFSLAIVVIRLAGTEQTAIQHGFAPLLPARAPPAIS